MKIIKKLPHWVITNLRPAFYDTDSGTAIEQTALVYKKMQELIENYNSFVTDVNNEIDEFISNTLADQEEFELKINQMIYDFTTLVDLEIKDAVNYMKTNINSSVSNVLMELFETKQVAIDFDYNTESESLDIKGVVVTERSGE